MESNRIDDTGERMIPEIHHEGMIYAEHMARYLFASQFVKGKRVLDIASGTGYGTEMLAVAGAKDVLGIDNEPESACRAHSRYGHSRGCHFAVGDAERLPLNGESLDVVVSFETIEHVPRHYRSLSEFKRILRPGGLLVISTPNHGVYPEGNPFHIKEFQIEEFRDELSFYFANVSLLSQENWIASGIFDQPVMGQADIPLRNGTGLYKAVAREYDKVPYVVGLCSDGPLPDASPQVTLTYAAEVYKYVERIAELQDEVRSQHEEDASRQREFDTMRASVAQLEKELESLGTAASESMAILSDQDRYIEESARKIDDLTHQLQAIRQSAGYRLLERGRRTVRWVFPPNSIRGVPYRAARRSAKGALNLVRRTPSAPAGIGQRRDGSGTAASRSNWLAPSGMVDPVRYALSTPWTPGQVNSSNRAPIDTARPWLNWVIPTIGESGGFRTIFRMVEALSQEGFQQRIYEMPLAHRPRLPEELGALIRKQFGVTLRHVSSDFENMEPADITFATSWHTAYPVLTANDGGRKFYLVQDFEPLFLPVGSESVLAENTYRFGFTGVTAGRWLCGKLESEYGMECDYFDLAVDPTVYHPKSRGPRRKIFFYARPATPRRGFDLGVRALEIFHERHPDYQVVMAGGEISGGRLPFPVKNGGYLNEEQLNDLYNQSAAALVISLTNCSLLPLEIMATGCPVVTTAGPNNEEVMPPNSAIFAQASPDCLAAALEEAVKRPFQQALVDLAGMHSWEAEGKKIASILRRAVGPPVTG
jgi:SAM-dependent methyltransferase/glycosyltransferase involved in cell wall biosynthesis